MLVNNSKMFITVDASTTIILNTKHHYETTQGVSYRDREPIHSSTTYQDVFQGIGKPFNPKLLERNDNDYLPLSPSTKTSRMAIPTLWHEPFIQSPDTIKQVYFAIIYIISHSQTFMYYQGSRI